MTMLPTAALNFWVSAERIMLRSWGREELVFSAKIVKSFIWTFAAFIMSQKSRGFYSNRCQKKGKFSKAAAQQILPIEWWLRTNVIMQDFATYRRIRIRGMSKPKCHLPPK